MEGDGVVAFDFDGRVSVEHVFVIGMSGLKCLVDLFFGRSDDAEIVGPAGGEFWSVGAKVPGANPFCRLCVLLVCDGSRIPPSMRIGGIWIRWLRGFSERSPAFVRGFDGEEEGGGSDGGAGGDEFAVLADERFWFGGGGI